MPSSDDESRTLGITQMVMEKKVHMMGMTGVWRKLTVRHVAKIKQQAGVTLKITWLTEWYD